RGRYQLRSGHDRLPHPRQRRRDSRHPAVLRRDGRCGARGAQSVRRARQERRAAGSRGTALRCGRRERHGGGGRKDDGMSEVSPSLVRELRERTGAGMMDCKKALTEVNGDIEKAQVYLREKGLAAAAKRAGRTAADGVVASYIHAGGKIGVLIEV